MKYKLSIYPCLELGVTGGVNHVVTHTYETAEEMLAASNTAANLLLFVHKHALMEDYSNMFVMEELDANGEWCEYEEEEET